MSGSTLYLEDYEDDRYDLIIFDEFTGQVPIFILNSLLDGSEVRFNVKGGHVVKRENLPVIILSNFSPRECYKNVDDLVLSTLESRLRIVKVESFIQVAKIDD